MTRIVVERIQLPLSNTPGEKPPSTLLDGELWVNVADHLIYSGVTGGAAVPLDGVPLEPLLAQLQPPLQHGWHTTASPAGAGGVPVLDMMGQVDPSMIAGTDMAPARRGEVPKFKHNGLIDIGLLDWDSRSVSEPTNSIVPTADDAAKLVRLDHLGRLNLRFLGINALDYQGKVFIGPAGTPLYSQLIDGVGIAGHVWIIATSGGAEYDVNTLTGDVLNANTGAVPAGYFRVKTGDIFVKDSQLQTEHIAADLLPFDHLLPRDGTRTMQGSLRFEQYGSGSTLDITGVKTVSAEEVNAGLLEASAQAGAPGVPNGAIRWYVIDGAENSIITRSGGDPTVGRVDGVAGELYVELGMEPKLYRHNGTGWELLLDGAMQTEIQQLQFEVATLTLELAKLKDDLAHLKNVARQ